MSDNKRAKIKIHVQPGAKQNQISGFKEGVLYIRITAPPVEGKANEALIKFLSKQLDISKSRISIDSGQSSRLKLVTVSGLSPEQLIKQISVPD
jgi:uncharacterized protein